MIDPIDLVALLRQCLAYVERAESDAGNPTDEGDNPLCDDLRNAIEAVADSI